MSSDNFFEQFFNIAPTKPQKKDQNDYLTNIFDLQTIPVSSQPQKKKKKDEQVHDLVKLAEKGNTKVKKGVEKWKQQRTMTPNQISQRRKIEKITQKFQQGKMHSQSIKPNGQKKIYLPNIIDPFAKPGDKQKKQKHQVQSPSEVVPREKVTKIQQKPKKQIKQEIKVKQRASEIKIKQKQRPSKIEAKQQKIIRKNQQKANIQKKIVKQNPLKKVKHSSSSSSSSSQSQSSQKQPQQMDWRKQLRQITKYNPGDEKFKLRDRLIIKQSGVERIFGQDRHSSRMGKLEEEEDLRKQLEAKYKKKKHSH